MTIRAQHTALGNFVQYCGPTTKGDKPPHVSVLVAKVIEIENSWVTYTTNNAGVADEIVPHQQAIPVAARKAAALALDTLVVSFAAFWQLRQERCSRLGYFLPGELACSALPVAIRADDVALGDFFKDR